MPEPPLDPAPAVPAAPPELVEEARLGGTPAGRAANGALLAFSRTARSLLLYDPRSEAVRAYIEDLRAKVEEALRVAGPLDLEVQPFELRLAGEVVYLERDRERSLAFRMFRDGVRRLTIRAEVQWEEVLRLLEILSIRYAGVRQNEDDIVTLLRKAAFAQIDVDAVLGFVPEEEDAGTDAAGRPLRSETRVEVPRDWDLPLRPLEIVAAVEYRPVAAEDLERLRAEEAPEALAPNAVRLVIEMLWAVADPVDPTGFDDVEVFIGEVCDFLVAEAQLGPLVTLVRELKGTAALDPGHVARVLTAMADRPAVGRMLYSVSPAAITPPLELVELLDLLPGDHFETLVGLLGEQRSEASRRHARILIERHAAGRSEAFFAHLHQAAPALVRDLLRACRRALPDRVLQAAIEMSSHADDDVALEALRILSTAAPDAPVGRALIRMLESPSQDVRLRVAEVLSGRKEHAAFAPLVRYVERRATHSLSPAEAQSYGEGLARLSPAASLSLFKAWAKPGRLDALAAKSHERLLRWAAVSGLGELQGEEPAALIRGVAEKADDELRAFCGAVLARRAAATRTGNG
jgi:hypothetical protein